jgi:subtilisin-like proprotein convertase family protein
LQLIFLSFYKKMKKLLLGFLVVLSPKIAAQTFNGIGDLNIPPGAPAQTQGITQSPCEVTGIGTLGGCVSITNVTIDLTHTWVGDIAIFLVAPTGQVLELSSGNGGAGDNFSGTVFSDNAPQFITAGAPPYSGNFRPEGRDNDLAQPYSNALPLGTYTFANTFNGVNADGTWLLYVNDYVTLDVGEINSWSITFSSGGTPPVANAGPDITICSGFLGTLTASGGTSYAWSTGQTTASINVTPTTTTTYTVTVTSAGCGTDTDEVTVTTQNPAISLTASPPSLCPTGSTTLTANSSLVEYDWSNGATTTSIVVSQPGFYSVTVSDGFCSTVAAINITGGSPPSVVFSVANPESCAGACNTVVATFTGVAPFNLTYETSAGTTQTQTFTSNSGSFQVCPPAGFLGSFLVTAVSLSDANCVCN